MSTLESAVAFGQICLVLGERDHRVRYVLDKLRLRPLRRCGNAHLWSPVVVDVVRAELARIDSKQRGQQKQSPGRDRQRGSEFGHVKDSVPL